MGEAYVENCLGFPAGNLSVLFRVRNELLGQPLGLFGLGPCGVDGLVLDQRCHQIAEQGLPVR
jgi:hypothetical protein